MGGPLRRVTEIRRTGRSRRRAVVYLDGEAWRTMPFAVVQRAGLRVGDDVDPEALARRTSESEAECARERALRLVTYRERSSAELRARLEEEGYAEAVVDATVSDLVRTGIVDDERFATALGHMLVGVRGYGRERARRELERRGVAAPTIEAVLDELAPLADEDDRASVVAQRIRRPSDDANRLAARLVRRGFSTRSALRAARRAVPDAPDENGNLL